MRRLLLATTLCLMSLVATAQKQYVFGRLMDSITDLPVQDVQVQNINGQTSDYTNGRGLFVLEATMGDTLSFARVGYYAKRIVLSAKLWAKDTLHLSLMPKTRELQSVIVSAYDYQDYQTDSMDRRHYFEETIGYAQPLLSNSNTGAGIGLSLERIFGRKQKNKKRAFRLLLRIERNRYVDFRFNPMLVHSYTGLRGDSLQQFINRYRPSYEWLRANAKQEDIMYYINDKLKAYFHRKK